MVVGQAPAGARLVLVGEAPGAQEDIAGVPFVGKAGQVLDRLLTEAGGDRDAVAILNVLKCRPPGNRRPTPGELAECRPWLQAQLALLAPAVICTLGMTATGWFLRERFGSRLRIAAVRGQLHQVGDWQVLPTYHPSGALRFGPSGQPMQALREDLRLAVTLSQEQSG